MTSAAAEPIDVVYTWVDGAWPGYAELLREYASSRHDLNPNRYRDNIDVLRYSLRSLARFAPWVRRVHLVTCRPQMPAWLHAGRVALVHHDEFIPREHLPTFNSFAIVSNLHRIPDLSRRFIYVEDDRVFGGPVAVNDFFDDRGRTWVYQALRGTPGADTNAAPGTSPWNLALAHSNGLLDARYGRQRRRTVKFAPLAIERGAWSDMVSAWPEDFARTSASRFRAAGNVAPEHLYPYFLLGERRGVPIPRHVYARRAWYHPLNNFMPLQRLGLARLRWFSPKFACLNDNFGDRPSAAVVRFVRGALERWFPERSPFER